MKVISKVYPKAIPKINLQVDNNHLEWFKSQISLNFSKKIIPRMKNLNQDTLNLKLSLQKMIKKK